MLRSKIDVFGIYPNIQRERERLTTTAFNMESYILWNGKLIFEKKKNMMDISEGVLGRCNIRGFSLSLQRNFVSTTKQVKQQWWHFNNWGFTRINKKGKLHPIIEIVAILECKWSKWLFQIILYNVFCVTSLSNTLTENIWMNISI